MAHIVKGDQIVLLKKIRSSLGDPVEGSTEPTVRDAAKGTVATVLQVLPTRKDKHSNKILGPFVIVEGVNIRRRHVKPTQTSPEGGIIEKEGPVHISNVALLDPKAGIDPETNKGTPTRIGYEMREIDGKQQKVRVSRKSGEVIGKPEREPRG